jgi:2-keto-3-deoxy-galactonokinase
VKRRAYYFEGKNGEELVERDVPDELEEQARGLQPHVAVPATACGCACNRMCLCLQPHVAVPACSRMYS